MKNVRIAGAIFATPSEKVQRIANASKIPSAPIEEIIEENEIKAEVIEEVVAKIDEPKAKKKTLREKLLSEQKKRG